MQICKAETFVIVFVLLILHKDVITRQTVAICWIWKSFLSTKSEMFPWRSARDSQMTNFLAVLSVWFLWFPDKEGVLWKSLRFLSFFLSCLSVFLCIFVLFLFLFLFLSLSFSFFFCFLSLSLPTLYFCRLKVIVEQVVWAHNKQE